MVIPYKYEEKFLNNELEIGLSLIGKEISAPDHKRIKLHSYCFEKVGDHYENTTIFGFPESISEWGFVDGCLCFDGDQLVTVGESTIKRYVRSYTQVVFMPKDFEIWFNE